MLFQDSPCSSKAFVVRSHCLWIQSSKCRSAHNCASACNPRACYAHGCSNSMSLTATRWIFEVHAAQNHRAHTHTE
eukprot:9139164-Alexandrium_andersonii.AAC.1